MTHQIDDSDAWLKLEFALLTQVCARLQAHPTLKAVAQTADDGSMHNWSGGTVADLGPSRTLH